LPYRVLVVEDEPDLAQGLKDNLEIEGYRVWACADGEAGVREALEQQPDLVLLDVMLPKRSGLDVCRTLRARGFVRPILMLTARGQEIDRVVGLEIGADDYITKPFGLRELLARIRAHLRRERRGETPEQTYAFDDVHIDFGRHIAVRGDETLQLSPREFELLRYFIRNRGRTVSREELLDAVWGLTNYPITRTVDNHIAKLRRKVDPSSPPEYIITVHKFGYKFLG
jgi:DNA-binding response OmpR family regulator